jgi:hypothetical protein
MWRLDITLAGSIPRQRKARSACNMYERPVGVARCSREPPTPPYDFIVVGVIQQGGSRGYDEYAFTPAEAMVPAPHTFDIEVSGDKSVRRQ